MDGFQVGRFFFEAQRRPDLIGEFRENPEAVMDKYGLTEAEKEAMRSRNIRALYEMGVPGLLLQRAANRVFDLQMGEYGKAIQGAVQVRK